jgi:RNA polymerase sigma-70 factor (ECF subfamily)
LYALSKVYGKREAIAEAEKLNFYDNHFYWALLGELYNSIDDRRAKENFEKAISLAKTLADKQTIQRKIERL